MCKFWFEMAVYVEMGSGCQRKYDLMAKTLEHAEI